MSHLWSLTPAEAEAPSILIRKPGNFASTIYIWLGQFCLMSAYRILWCKITGVSIDQSNLPVYYCNTKSDIIHVFLALHFTKVKCQHC